MKTEQSVFLPMARVNRILSFLLENMKGMDDEDRDLPVRWNIMHMYSSCQLAKILAIKRGLDPELAALAAAFHDVGVVYSRRRKNHDKNAEAYVRDIIARFNGDFGKDLDTLTLREEETIIKAIIDHSNKSDVSEDGYAELMKDVDSFDRMLHGIKTKDDHLKRAGNYALDLGMDLYNI